MRAVVLVLLVACSLDVEAPKGGAAIIGEELCAPYGYTCGHVYQFDDRPADNPLGLLEMCVRDKHLELAQARYGAAQFSTDPRFDEGNLCVWQCPSAKGCNSYSGCFCDVPPE